MERPLLLPSWYLLLSVAPTRLLCLSSSHTDQVIQKSSLL